MNGSAKSSCEGLEHVHNPFMMSLDGIVRVHRGVDRTFDILVHGHSGWKMPFGRAVQLQGVFDGAGIAGALVIFRFRRNGLKKRPTRLGSEA